MALAASIICATGLDAKLRNTESCSFTKRLNGFSQSSKAQKLSALKVDLIVLIGDEFWEDKKWLKRLLNDWCSTNNLQSFDFLNVVAFFTSAKFDAHSKPFWSYCNFCSGKITQSLYNICWTLQIYLQLFNRWCHRKLFPVLESLMLQLSKNCALIFSVLFFRKWFAPKVDI